MHNQPGGEAGAEEATAASPTNIPPASPLHHRASRFTFHPSPFTLFLAAALLIAGLAAWPLIAQPGLLNTRGGGDSPFLLQRVQQLEQALRGGHFPVRWMPDANYGYGYPFFNYYAPLSLYGAAVFRFIGFSYVRSIQLAQLAGFLIAAWGMFRLGRRWLGDEWAGLLAAVAYTIAPFHLVNVYVRGDSLAEFWAMAFYPLTLLAADDLLHAARSGMKRRVYMARFALAYAALILSHNISALIFTPFLLLYILLRLGGAGGEGDTAVSPTVASPLRRYVSRFIPMLIALLLAFALAAWFFLPALREQSLAQLGPVTQGYFHYSNHFRGADLVQGSLLFDYRVEEQNTFRMGLVQAVTAVLGLLTLLLYRHPSRPPRRFILAAFLLATFMLTPLSRPLWDHLPLLPFTQFPWRFLSVQAFAGALATGALAWLSGRRLAAPLMIGLLFVSSLGGLRTDHLVLTDEDITAERLAQYEWFTGNIGTTVSAEYLPHTVQPRPTTSLWLNRGERWVIQPLSGELIRSRLVQRSAVSQVWQVETTAGATLLFPTMYWPGWRATVAGESVAIWPSPGSGLITLNVPPGEHRVVLSLGRTPVRLIAEVVSLIALAITLWLWRPWRAFRLRPSHAWGLLALILLLSGRRLWPQRPLSPGDLTWDFAQMGYLHHDREGVSFSDGSRLVTYTYSREMVAAGEPLTITLTFDPTPTGQMSLALTTPAVNRFAHVPVLVSQTIMPGDPAVYHFTIPADAPGGLYAPRLILADAYPLTPSGQPRGDLFLRPIRILPAQTAATADAAPLDVHAVMVQQRDPATLDMQLAWVTRQPLSANYNYSLRLVDAAGVDIAQFDGQPGYGFQPSSGWQVGRWTNDWLALPLPEPLPGGAPYALLVYLYDVESGTVALTRRLGFVMPQAGELRFRPNEPIFALPAGTQPAPAVFRQDSADLIRLHGYTLNQTSEALHLTLQWEALATQPVEYTRFVHLVSVAGGAPVAQVDGRPQRNSYPTSQWTTGEIITDPVTLELTAVPPGDYQLVVGFYRHLGNTLPRLTAVAADGVPLPYDQAPLPISITIPQEAE